MTTTLKKIGGSLAVIIPKAIAAGFSAGDKIDLSEQDNGILLTRQRTRTRRPLNEIVQQMDTDAYARHRKAFQQDAPVGREIW